MQRAIGLVVGLLAASACTGDIMAPDDDDDDDDDTTAMLTIVTPTSGSSHSREVLDDLGYLVAEVGVEVETAGPITRVAFSAGDGTLGDAAADGTFAAAFRDDGAVTLIATGYDADGNVVDEAAVGITIAAPVVDDCHGWLDLYGQAYELGPNNEGVPDPVTLTTPINGMPYRYVSNENPRETFFMDCSLAVSLLRAAPLLRERDVVEVADIGVYNYRCIGGEGTPPDCPQGISQHAYAKGIDLAGFTDVDGNFFSVNDDWVIDPDAEDTCAAGVEAGADAFLHELICSLKGADTWNIVLTPNYNDAHRNHFHVDMTTGADFIRAATGGRTVDDGPDYH
jgi:hypothetical protein